jgi:glycosyltransferase involved in cell wall biosynthesis
MPVMETPSTGPTDPVEESPDPPKPTLSIVIPAFNEVLRIGSTLDRILAFVDAHQLETEVIVVDDGSTDQTASIASKKKLKKLRILTNDGNRGKGYSVRRGALEATGTWILFTDADLSAPIEELDRLLGAINDEADVAIGSRAVDRSKILVHQARFRELGGIVFNWAVQLILGLRLHDTQCGFKLFRREKVLEVFERQTIHGFGFDPEILFLAKQRGLEIREVPVLWSNDRSTKVRFLRDGVGMFLDLLRIRWRWITGKYG